MDPHELFSQALDAVHKTPPRGPDGLNSKEHVVAMNYVFDLLRWAGNDTAILSPPASFPADDYAVEEREAIMAANKD